MNSCVYKIQHCYTFRYLLTLLWKILDNGWPTLLQAEKTDSSLPISEIHILDPLDLGVIVKNFLKMEIKAQLNKKKHFM